MRKGTLHGPLGPLHSIQDRLRSHPSAAPARAFGKESWSGVQRGALPSPRALQQSLAQPLRSLGGVGCWPAASPASVPAAVPPTWPLGLRDWAPLPVDPKALGQQGFSLRAICF